MSSFKTVDAADFVTKAYGELVDGNLRTLPVGVPLSTESFEPTDHGSRFRWVENMQLSKQCCMVNCSVGGHVGTLHWTITLDEGLDGAELTNELEGHRRRLKALVPVMHSRIVKRNVVHRFRDVT
jgi:hypothetical protein